MTSVTCVTTRYLPNLRHLARVHEADVVVLLDLALLPDRNSNSFVNRNRIYNDRSAKTAWLTVPITRGRGQAIKDVLIAPGERWWAKGHIDKIQAFIPNHESVAPGFVTALSEQLTNHPTHLLTLNASINTFLLSQLKRPASWLFESKLVKAHSVFHRLEISTALGATRYVAGDVEWKAMKADGELEMFTGAGIEVTKSPNPSELGLDESMVRELSCVDAVCRYGVRKTAEVLSRMIELGRQARSHSI